MNLKDYIRSIQDYPKKGILFRDITTLIKEEKAFSETINQIVERSKKYNFTKIAAIESRGFVFASAVSYILKKPFIMLRKKNKLPADVHSIDFELEYGTATIEVHKDSLNKNDSVLIIDDLIATGGTAEEAAKQAVENDVHILGVSSLAGSHKTLVPKVINTLRTYGRGDIMVIVGGVIPKQDYRYLFDAGTVAIFGPGTKISDTAITVLEILIN